MLQFLKFLTFECLLKRIDSLRYMSHKYNLIMRANLYCVRVCQLQKKGGFNDFD